MAATNSDHNRLNYARKCMKLARRELRTTGRRFVLGREDLVDMAIQYGTSARITREEVLATMDRTNRIVDDIKLALGVWLRQQGFRTGDPTVPSDCSLDVFTDTGYWLCSLTFCDTGVRPVHATASGTLSRATRKMLFEYANPDFFELIRHHVEGRLIRCEPHNAHAC